jgi:hypothetical protein
MRHHTFALAILLTLFALARAVDTLFITNEVSIATWGHPSTRFDAESVLAHGDKLQLSCLDLADLELLPGISDTIGRAVISHRPQIAAAHRITGDSSALEEVPGIGEKRARELYRYLEVSTTPCSHSP